MKQKLKKVRTRIKQKAKTIKSKNLIKKTVSQ